jgi:hypothetical protein
MSQPPNVRRHLAPDVSRALQPARVSRNIVRSGASMGATDDVECVRGAAATPGAVLLLAEAEDESIGTLLGTFDGWRGNLYRMVCIRTAVAKESADNSFCGSKRSSQVGACDESPC